MEYKDTRKKLKAQMHFKNAVIVIHNFAFKLIHSRSTFILWLRWKIMMKYFLHTALNSTMEPWAQSKTSDFPQFYVLLPTIEIFFLIWISRSFKKGASDNTISYFEQSFWFSGLWLILARNLGRSGQNKSWGTEKRERTNNFFFKF